MTALERAQAIEEAGTALVFAWDQMQDTSIMSSIPKKFARIKECEDALRAALALEVENYEQKEARIFGWKGDKP